MERKRLIRPITVLKVKKYMTEVFKKVLAGETFSADQLARKHQLSGSTGTALIKNGWIIQTDVKFQFTFTKDMGEKRRDQPVTDLEAKQLIEQVRLMNDKSAKNDRIEIQGTTREGKQTARVLEDNSSDDGLDGIKLKSREGAEIGSILKRALQQSTSVHSLFDEQKKNQDQLIQIASAIAGGVYRESHSHINQFSQERIMELNDAIVFASTDLQKRLSGEIKTNRFVPDS